MSKISGIILVFVMVGAMLAPVQASGDTESEGTSQWTTNGPPGGYISSLAMAPTNPDIIYAGTDGGVFKTVNEGDTWTRTGFPEILVWVVQVAPDNSDIVYAGTNDGIYKSEDGGSTWTQKGLSGAMVNAIAIDPLNPDILYAGAGKPETSYSGEIIGIFKSTDAGETWQLKLSEGLDAVAALLIDTDNSSYIYAGVYTEGSGPGLRKSTDGGETWVSRRINPRGSFDNVVALAMTPAGCDPAVICAFSFGYDDDVYKSMDRGESWTGTNLSLDCGYYQKHVSLAIDPNEPHTIYMSNWCLVFPPGGVYKTSDGGETWSLKANGLPPSVPFSIVIDPRNSDVYVGLSEGGVYKSTDGAESWNFSSHGISETSIIGLAVDPASSGTVFASVREIGLAKTTNSGTSWGYLAGLPTDLGAVAIDPQNPSTIWVGDGNHYDNRFYVYKSTDGGQSWTSIQFVHYSPDWTCTGVTDILIKADDSDSVLVSMHLWDGILARTTDGGLTWDNVGCALTTLAADPNNPNVVYYGKTRVGQVFRSTGFGLGTVTEITPAEGIGGISDIEVDSDSKVYVAASDGLWRWDGSDWTNLTGLPTDDINDLAIDRSTSPGTIYAGTQDEGVFVSPDGGSTWIPFNEGLGNFPITELAISASQPKMLYAGTLHGGVYGRMIGDLNNPPYEPVNPSPANHTTNVSIDADLSWSGGDPDAGDSVTYDVYFDTTDATTLVASGQSSTTYSPPGILTYNTTYYWKIVATDNHGASTTGPLWDFTTQRVCGDVAPYPDCDGIINMGDVVLLLNYVGHPGEYQLCCEWCGDVAPCPASDGIINMGDVVLLLNYVGHPGEYELCCE